MTEIHNLTHLAEYAHDQIERITRMQRQLDEHVGEGESPRGLVRARIGPGGHIVDLHLDPGVLRLPIDAATAEIIAAVTAAQRDFAARADDIIAPVLAVRPGEQASEALDRGMQRLDELTADLERLAARRDLVH